MSRRYRLFTPEKKNTRLEKVLHLVEVLIIVSGFIATNLLQLPHTILTFFVGLSFFSFLIFAILIHAFSINIEDTKYLNNAYKATALSFPAMLILFYMDSGFVNIDFENNFIFAVFSTVVLAFAIILFAFVLMLAFDEKLVSSLIEFNKRRRNSHTENIHIYSSIFVIAYTVLIDIAACLQQYQIVINMLRLALFLILYVILQDVFTIKETKDASYLDKTISSLLRFFILFLFIIIISSFNIPWPA